MGGALRFHDVSSSSQRPHIILLGSLGVFEPMCQMIRRKKKNIKKSHKRVAKRQRMAKEYIYIYSTIHTLPVVPHKAVAEVSRIENL